MSIDIPADLAEFVQEAISRGSFKSETEVVGAALRLLREQESLRNDVATGVAELVAGSATEYDDGGLAARLEAIKASGRERLPSHTGDK